MHYADYINKTSKYHYKTTTNVFADMVLQDCNSNLVESNLCKPKTYLNAMFHALVTACRILLLITIESKP